MAYLAAAVVVVGVLAVLNLLLSYGVIRRLREHSALLAQRPAGLPNAIAAAGSVVAPFTATTVDGRTVGVDLAPGTLVGFFSPGCSACVEQLPLFVDAAAAHPGGPERVLAVVLGAAEGAEKYVDALSPQATVVVDRHGTEIENAFAVRAYPGFAMVGDGRVVTVSGRLAEVTAVAKSGV
ncbi:hypothetical protein ACQEVB_14785 [Pseudonocardia sp. CA-107938]|uniref:hypothetical protein n=1 Tax=Pseudonocardia sp. CA-107938 TaxID=3240021 RepID=UPI003D93210A